jgi:hypothetical protein
MYAFALLALLGLATGLHAYRPRHFSHLSTRPRHFRLFSAAVGSKVTTPPSIEVMMLQVARAITSFTSSISSMPWSSRVGVVELPLPVTGGTELDDWPGGIKQKFSVLKPMIETSLKQLNFSSTGSLSYLNGESGQEDCVAVWQAPGLSVVTFATPECIPEIRQLAENGVVIVVNPQFFLDPLSSKGSKEFVASATTVFELTQLNMRGEALGGALPVRGIISREFPNKFVTARRLDGGGYVLLREWDTRPSRAEMETVFLEDSKIRDAQLSLVDKLRKLVPRVD